MNVNIMLKASNSFLHSNNFSYTAAFSTMKKKSRGRIVKLYDLAELANMTHTLTFILVAFYIY